MFRFLPSFECTLWLSRKVKGDMEPVNRQILQSRPESSIDQQISLHEEYLSRQSYLSKLTSVLSGNGDDKLSHLKQLKAHGGVLSGPNGGADVLKAIEEDRQCLQRDSRIAGYVSTFARTASMFLPGRYGYVLSASLGALDRARPSEGLGVQALDASLGAAEGSLMKGAATWLGQSELPIALNGMALGAGSRTLHTALDRQTWTGKDGQFTLDGAARTWSEATNKEAVVTDILSFSAGMAATGAIGSITGGALTRNLPLARLVSGATFGASSGMTAEISQEKNSKSQLDWAKIAQEGAIQALIGGAAAVPGGMLEVRQARNPEYLLANGKLNADVQKTKSNQLGDSWQHELKEATINAGNSELPVIVRSFAQGSGASVPFELSQAGYRLNKVIGLDDNIPAVAARTIEVGGQPQRVWIQEKVEGVKDLNSILEERLKDYDGSATKLLEANPSFEQQLQKILALRLVAQDTDLQAFQILVKPNPEAPNDLNQAKLYHLDFDTWFVPGTKYPEWSPNTLFGGMNDIAEHYAGRPLAEPIRAQLIQFAERYASPASRASLQENLGLTAEQIDGIINRAGTLSSDGRYPGYLGIAQQADFTRHFGSMQVKGLMKGQPPSLDDIAHAIENRGNGNEQTLLTGIRNDAKDEPNEQLRQSVYDRIDRINTLAAGNERNAEMLTLFSDYIALVKRALIRENEANRTAAEAKLNH